MAPLADMATALGQQERLKCLNPVHVQGSSETQQVRLCITQTLLAPQAAFASRGSDNDA